LKATEVGEVCGKIAAKVLVTAKSATEKAGKNTGALSASIIAAAKAAKAAFESELRNNRS